MSIFNGSSFGLANTVRHTVGLDPISWISSPNPPWYWLVLVTVRLWLQLGIYMIIFIAGLQEIPRELYEAAWLMARDEAGRPSATLPFQCCATRLSQCSC